MCGHESFTPEHQTSSLGASPMKLFLIANAIFVAAFLWLIVLQPGWVVWAGFIALWCVIDLWISKDMHLAWWHWVIFIAVLIAIDLVALRILGQI